MRAPGSAISFIVPHGKIVSSLAKRIHYEPYHENEDGLEAARYPMMEVEKRLHQQYCKDMAPLQVDTETLLTTESEDKAAYLKTLETILRERGIESDLTRQFKDAAWVGGHYDAQLYTLRPMIVMRDFAVTKKEGYRYSHSETPGPFRSSFSVLRRDLPRTAVSVPLYEFDSAVWDVLKRHHVSDQEQKNYCEDFLRMADVAEHDYLHQLIDTTLEHAHYAFPPQCESGTISDFRHEDALFALQVKICRRLFADHPEFKTQVLGWAARQGQGIAAMEKTALDHARATNAPAEDQAQIRAASDYLASYFMHRLLRVFDPNDPDLKQPLTCKIAGEMTRTSVAAEFNKITALQHDGEKGFDALVQRCDRSFDQTYSRIHAMETVTLYQLPYPAYAMKGDSPAAQPEAMPVEVPVEEVVALFGKVLEREDVHQVMVAQRRAVAAASPQK